MAEGKNKVVRALKELEELVKVLEKYMDDAKWYLDNNYPEPNDKRLDSYPVSKTMYQVYRTCYLAANKTLQKAQGVVKPGD